MLFKNTPKRIYLDYASATPLCTEALAAMRPYFSEHFGNAGAIHEEGVTARNAIEGAREALASVLHVRKEGIVFTGSGTESNNLAILGTLASRKKEGVRYEDMEILSTKIEHPSILEVLAHVQDLGVQVTYVPVLEDGLIDIRAFEESLSTKTVLVTFAYANSEIGVVQHVGKIARIVRAFEKEHTTRIAVHVDAAQAPLWLSCELDRIGADLLSLDAGKCYGPKGVGVLAYRHGVTLEPHIYGGGQEGGLRPGTENTALIVGAVIALVRAQKNYEERAANVTVLRDSGIAQLESIDGVVLNGSRVNRLANNINISIPGVDSEYAVITLNEHKVACSTKSACGGAKGDGSSVVRTITNDDARATSTIRFTLGETTTASELQTVVALLRKHVAQMQTFLKGH